MMRVPLNRGPLKIPMTQPQTPRCLRGGQSGPGARKIRFADRGPGFYSYAHTNILSMFEVVPSFLLRLWSSHPFCGPWSSPQDMCTDSELIPQNGTWNESVHLSQPWSWSLLLLLMSIQPRYNKRCLTKRMRYVRQRMSCSR